MSGIIALMIYLAIVWLVAYLITTFIPVPEPGKTIIYVVAGIFSLLLVLQAFGLTDGSMKTPRIDIN